MTWPDNAGCIRYNKHDSVFDFSWLRTSASENRISKYINMKIRIPISKIFHQNVCQFLSISMFCDDFTGKIKIPVKYYNNQNIILVSSRWRYSCCMYILWTPKSHKIRRSILFCTSQYRKSWHLIGEKGYLTNF